MRCVKIDFMIMNYSILQVGALVRAHGQGQGQVFSPLLQGYLAHTKQTPSGTLQSDYVQGHMEVRGERAASYEPLSSLDKDKDRSYLTECVHQSFSESQLPYKIVNLLFTITDSNMKLTVWWGC